MTFSCGRVILAIFKCQSIVISMTFNSTGYNFVKMKVKIKCILKCNQILTVWWIIPSFFFCIKFCRFVICWYEVLFGVDVFFCYSPHIPIICAIGLVWVSWLLFFLHSEESLALSRRTITIAIGSLSAALARETFCCVLIGCDCGSAGKMLILGLWSSR